MGKSVHGDDDGASAPSGSIIVARNAWPRKRPRP